MDKTEEIMSRLKKEWDEIAARSKVSEVGLDVDRAKALARYAKEGLAHRDIATAIGISHQFVTDMLRFNRFLAATAAKVPERRFRAYWRQVSDPKFTKGKREIDHEYEAACFANISKLIDAGIAPMKPIKKEREVTPDDIASIKDVAKAARRIYRELKPELDRMKRLSGADRATYAPTLLADSAAIIERKIQQIFKILGAISEDKSEHGAAVGASAGN